MACPVTVYQSPDLLRPGREIPDEGLHLPIPVRLRRRDDADARGEAIEDAAEVLPVMLHPVAMASEWIGHIDESTADVLLAVFLRELGDLAFLPLPLVLRIEDQGLERPSVLLLKTSREQVGQSDLPAESADMLEAADAQSCIHDDVRLRSNVGLRLQE